MTVKDTSMPGAIDGNDKWLYKAAGFFAFGIGLLFVVEIILGVALGKLPGDSGPDWISFVNDKSKAWTGIIYLTIVIDLLFLGVYVTLYSALRSVNRGLILIATVLAVFGTVLDEVIANANFASLLTLGSQYASAGTAAQRAADVAAADYAASLLSTRLESIFAFIIPAVAIVLISIVMLRSPFGKRTAYLGIAAGIFDAISMTGWDLPSLLSTVLQAVWFVLLGRTLLMRYAAPAPVAVATTELSGDPLSV
jgi:hypothetical protein